MMSNVPRDVRCLSVYASRDEARWFQQLADRENMSVSAWLLRSAIRQGLGAPDQLELIEQVSRAGARHDAD